jgi:hypothetical protein
VLDGLEGFIGVVEGEDLDLGLDADFGGELEEVGGVLTGHVGDAADLAFAPEEFVVVEGGHLVEVDGVDGDDASFAETREGAEDDRSAGGEGDGAVELDGRLVVFGADPSGSEGGGLLTMVFAAGGDVDLAVPVTEDFDGLTGGGSEAEEADMFAGLGSRDAEAAEADDAGAQEGCDVGVVEGGRQGIGEVGADESVLGVAAVYGIASEDWVVAEVFFVAKAERAGAVGATDPGDAYSHASGAVGSCAVDDFAYDLVAGDEGLVDEGKVALEDVEIGAADSAGEDAEEEMAFGEGGAGDFFDLEGLVGGVEDGCFHAGLLCAMLIRFGLMRSG